MPKFPKGFKDVDFYPHRVKPGKKRRRLIGTTRATSDFLAIVHEQHPDMTIGQLRNLLLDKTQFIYEPDAVAVLDAYIKAGEKDVVPNFGFGGRLYALNGSSSINKYFSGDDES